MLLYVLNLDFLYQLVLKYKQYIERAHNNNICDTLARLLLRKRQSAKTLKLWIVERWDAACKNIKTNSKRCFWRVKVLKACLYQSVPKSKTRKQQQKSDSKKNIRNVCRNIISNRKTYIDVKMFWPKYTRTIPARNVTMCRTWCCVLSAIYIFVTQSRTKNLNT